MMHWQVRIRYSNGIEEVLYSYREQSAAQRCVDTIYSQNGYPLHLAYVVRPEGEKAFWFGSEV